MRKAIYVICAVFTFFSFALKIYSLSNIELSSGELSPFFNENVYKYNIYLDKENEVNISFILEENEILEGETNVNLKSGENLKEYKISKLGETKYYKLVFQVGECIEENEALLKELEIDNFDINFQKDKYIYNIESKEKNLNIKYIPVNSDSKVFLEKTNDKITIKVELDEKENTYVINIKNIEEVFKENKNNKIFLSNIVLNNEEKLVIKIVIIIIIIFLIYYLFRFLFLKKKK